MSDDRLALARSVVVGMAPSTELWVTLLAHFVRERWILKRESRGRIEPRGTLPGLDARAGSC